MTDAPDTALPPAGWYPDPQDPGGGMRWWGGQGWTGHTAAVIERMPAPPPRPPRKWLGPWGGLWIAAACVAVWLLEFLVSWVLGPVQKPSPIEYQVLDPVLLVIGSCCVAAAFLYTMAYRLEPRWGLSPVRLVGGGLLAGLGAAIVAGIVNGAVNAFAGGTLAVPSTLTFVLVGVVEEGAKIGATMLLARGMPVKSARVGLFLGAAVGFGFSAIENVGYLETAWSVGLAHHQAVETVLATAISRQLLGPLLHPVLTGLLAAAVFGAARNGRFRVTLPVVGAYLAVAAAHSGYDLGSSAADALPDRYLGAVVSLLTVGAFVVASVVAWLLISRALKHRDPPSFAP
ncbi:MAG TPA: PrsW family glutamic-type intramembrane protease [Gryllotalpicola sp.]